MKAAYLYGAFADSQGLPFRSASAARRVSDRRNGQYVSLRRRRCRSLGNIAFYPSAPRNPRGDARPYPVTLAQQAWAVQTHSFGNRLLHNTLYARDGEVLFCSSGNERSKAGLLPTDVLKRILMNGKPMVCKTAPAADAQTMAVSCSFTRNIGRSK